ncbi:MAG: AmmeMemoRadiSam system protein A, partial [Acidobacteriales bacterium]|nr:AmmeMemoRadiSam system protein A [Terriglobales bacterium]
MCAEPEERQTRSTGCHSAATGTGEFTPEERETLLELARKSIRAALEHRAIDLSPPSAHLAKPRGVFTTLYLHGSLRGCVGNVVPSASVYQTVAETACSAAFEDSRFASVNEEEAPDLQISLSILSPLFPIKPEEIEVGRHGLLISHAGRRGLLLPQVPVEHGWDRLTFLEQTCRKAGLPADAWRSGAEI